MTSITAERLTKRYGDMTAVDDLSFQLKAGTITGFLGRNGAGKTTTLRMLLGLVIPTSGTSAIGGMPYGELPEPLHTVGAVLGTESFHPARRARDHLRVVATAGRLSPARVDEVLATVGLEQDAARKVGKYSLGMKQRLGIAVALLGNPRVLILDEPVNGLDPGGVRWMRGFLRGFADQGGTVLLSSHLLSEVAQTVDEVLIIARGRLVAHSSLRDLMQRATPVVRVRTPSPDRLRDALERKGILVELGGADTLLVFDTSTENVGLAAAGSDVVVYEMTAEPLDLEETFLELTTTGGVT